MTQITKWVSIATRYSKDDEKSKANQYIHIHKIPLDFKKIQEEGSLFKAQPKKERVSAKMNLLSTLTGFWVMGN